MDISENLIQGLLDINHMMRMLYEGKASQSRILIILYENNSMTQKKLTEYLEIQPGSVSEILIKLEKAELITRIHSQEDRRTMIISLTEKGEKQAKEAVERRRERHQQMFVGLTEEEKKSFLSILEKLNIDWKERFLLSGRQTKYGKKNSCKVEKGEK